MLRGDSNSWELNFAIVACKSLNLFSIRVKKRPRFEGKDH